MRGVRENARGGGRPCPRLGPRLGLQVQAAVEVAAVARGSNADPPDLRRRDPWGGGGFLRASDALPGGAVFVMQETAHHQDLRLPSANDPATSVPLTLPMETSVVEVAVGRKPATSSSGGGGGPAGGSPGGSGGPSGGSAGGPALSSSTTAAAKWQVFGKAT